MSGNQDDFARDGGGLLAGEEEAGFPLFRE
jgi:hypothetical protein